MSKIEPAADALTALTDMGRSARAAARALALAPTGTKNAALRAMAAALRADIGLIRRENEADLAAAREKDLKASFLDRLTLTHTGIEAMANGLDEIANLPDPVGVVTEWWEGPTGSSSGGCACRSASSASSMKAGPM